VNGVTLDDLSEAERIFEMNIQVCLLVPRQTAESLKKRRRRGNVQEDKFTLN
jgi:hypothetical protein